MLVKSYTQLQAKIQIPHQPNNLHDIIIMQAKVEHVNKMLMHGCSCLGTDEKSLLQHP